MRRELPITYRTVIIGSTPIFTLGGVILPLERWRDYDRGYLYLKRQFFSAEMINLKKKIDCVWEIKGADLVAPRNAGSERNKVFSYKVLDLIKEFGGKVIGVTFIEAASGIPNTQETSIYTKGLQIIAERYDIFLRENAGCGILILNSRMAHTRKGASFTLYSRNQLPKFYFRKQGRSIVKKGYLKRAIFSNSRSSRPACKSPTLYQR